jgi:hypothetical protein
MNFKLVKKGTDHELTRFRVVDSLGTICGHISVPTREVSALLRCWLGATDSPPKSWTKNALTEALVQARKKQAPLSQATILRGCLYI